jgi:hypothetical protein
MLARRIGRSSANPDDATTFGVALHFGTAPLSSSDRHPDRALIGGISGSGHARLQPVSNGKALAEITGFDRAELSIRDAPVCPLSRRGAEFAENYFDRLL